ncbi:hypothetical protein [Bacillus cereus group sp. BY6-1LC]|uniref:hypothetical protein n=1 Tax=Bacillus cereus group sp. BY6-1LC TaxID=3018077 RepID=UPI0022E2115A|nr:hypothetical protein [Bacillus cereus group sp. BY6-1LC]MDA1802679.1 hypothetical protein [Bacillus cereus group sp. BY6-1LC]
MKLTLFTISNEQIKEQLSKLQTKVESLENTKELQDKVISMQDHQISFLNDSIANMWAPIGIVAGIAALVITGAFTYVSILHHQAKKKREEVEELIRQSHSMATIAQGKIDEINIEQQNLQDLATSIDLKQKVDMHLNRIKLALETIESSQKSILEKYSQDGYKLSQENASKLQNYMTQRYTLKTRFNTLYIFITQLIVEGAAINAKQADDILALQNDCDDLFNGYFSFEDELEGNEI